MRLIRKAERKGNSNGIPMPEIYKKRLEDMRNESKEN